MKIVRIEGLEGLEPIEELELILEDVLRILGEKGEAELAFKIIKALGLLDVVKKELQIAQRRSQEWEGLERFHLLAALS